MAEREKPEFAVYDAVLIWKNFAGKAMQFNTEGDRNFHVILDAETAVQLDADGWNVKMRAAQEEGEEPFFHMKVIVSFKNYPPKIFLISNEGKTRVKLDEDQLSLLDVADVKTWDLMITGYNWDYNGKQGISAYLKSAYITLQEDELDRKYGALPPS